MEIGAHLPLMDFGDHPFTLHHLIRYSETAARLGFAAVAANDHLTFAVPWLDGPTALAAVLAPQWRDVAGHDCCIAQRSRSGPLVKSLGAIDRLSGGRLIVGVGPGSSDRDYAAVGIDFEERWARIDEAVETMRTLWRRDGSRFTGRFYSTDGVSLEPGPTSVDGPPVWIGSWGSLAGLRRVARLGDGWLASAYNTTPALFAAAWAALRDLLIQEGKDPWVFPNALATMWCYITEDAAEAARIIEERVAPAVTPKSPGGRPCRAVRRTAQRLRCGRRPASLHLAGC